jgi:lysophospholipase L1-like esterase
MKDLRICFVGDSFINGTGDPAYLGWAGRICATAQQQGLEITYYNLGIRRQTSRDIAQRWQAEVSARLPANCDGRIVFSFGVNDTTIENGKERVALDESVENARTILQNARSFFPTIMIGPPPILEEEHNQRIARLSQQFALVCETLEIPYLEVFTPLRHVREWQEEIASNDGAHPRAAGYAALAELIQDWSAWRTWLA